MLRRMRRRRSDYFDSLYHADVIVGLNTSAMIEGAIVGRPVHTVLLPEFTESQEGTIHFHYLLNDTHGVLRATRSLDEHADDLAATLEGRGADADRSARFVRTFVRPGGLESPRPRASSMSWSNWSDSLRRRPSPYRRGRI